MAATDDDAENDDSFDDAPEDDAPEDDAPEDDAPEDDAPEDDAPEDDAPEDDAPEDDAPEDDAPEDDAPEGGRGSPEPRAATPSVTAVVVAHEPGEWFEATLESIVTQDYPRLDLLVVMASPDPLLAERVGAVAPDASVLDASDTNGFGPAANTILEAEVSSAYVLLCHDDVLLSSDCVRVLVTESLRSNAAVTGPKLVSWDRPEALQHVGLGVDRFAVPSELIEVDELDQEQYDAVADVFAIPSACMLVRTNLFAAIGGFDPGMNRRGEDVDFCWRAQLVGGRVLVAPDAVVRHREDLPTRIGVDDIRRSRARHQLRTLLVSENWLGLIVTLPLLAVMSVAEMVIAALSGRIGHVRDIFGAWVWNARNLRSTLNRRSALQRMTTARHSDVRALQQPGSSRISAFVRGQIGRGDGRFGRDIATAMRTGTTRFSVITWVLACLFVLFGSRAFITGGVPAVGGFAPFGDDSGELIRQWWSGWRDRDLGSVGVGSSGIGLLGVLAAVLGGATGLVRTMWVLAPLFIGMTGAWRMLGVTGSRRAQIGTLITYLAVPLPWAAVELASIEGLYAYAVAPWVLLALLHAQATPPFRSVAGPVRGIVRTAFGLGTAVGLAALFEPAVALVPAVILLGLIAGSLVAINPSGVVRLVLVPLVAAPFVALVTLPQMLDLVMSPPAWDFFSGGRDGSASFEPLADLVRLSPGTGSPSPLVWAFGLPMALALFVGRAWRFDLAVRLWFVALASWGVALADAHGWLGVGLPSSTVILAPAAAAVAALCGCAVASAEHDLRRTHFGWRQALMPAALIAAVVAVVPGFGELESGRWGLGRGDFANAAPFADPAVAGSYRVVWIGDPEILPAGGRALTGGLAWVATLDGMPTIDDHHAAIDDGNAELMESVILSVLEGDTGRGGRLLGGLGVRYVVGLERLAPAPFSAENEARPLPALFGERFGEQLDLREMVGVNSALRVYENTEWTSVRAAAVPDFDRGVDELADLGTEPISGTVGVLSGRGDSITGGVPDATDVLVLQTPDPDWTLTVAGDAAPRRRAAGWATAFVPSAGGQARLHYDTPLWRHAAIIVQLIALAGVVMLRVRRATGDAG